MFIIFVLGAGLLLNIEKREGKTDFYHVAKSIYDTSAAVKTNDFYAKADDAKRNIVYANVNNADKYRLMRILEAVENEHINANVEKNKSASDAVSSIFDLCKTYYDDEFYAQVRRIYKDLFSEEQLSYENVNTEKSLKDEKYIRGLLYSGCGKTISDSDGNLWIYGENYFCELDERDIPIFVAADMKTEWNSLLRRLNNKLFYSRTDIVSELLESGAGVEKHKISPSEELNSYIITEKDVLFNKIYYIDFLMYK